MLLKGEVSSSPFEGHENHVKSVTYSPDGKQIASSGSDDFTVWVWEVSTGLRRTFRAHSNEIGCLAFSPDSTLIVSDTTLIILSTGRCFRNALGKANFPGRAVDPFAFSADGRYLAWGGLNWCCKIYDASTHQTIVQLVGHTGDLLSVAFFPDDKQIMSASEDGTIRLWNVELLEERGEMDRWKMYCGGTRGRVSFLDSVSIQAYEERSEERRVGKECLE